MREMFISLLSSGRVYVRFLVTSLSYIHLTIHRLMVRLNDKKGLKSRLNVVWYMRVLHTGCMLFLGCN